MGSRAKKSWGQNFLHDRSVLARIVAAVGATADDVVVEIGAGLGTLTVALAQAAPAPRRVLAVERDPDMQRVLAAELAGDARVEVVGADALAFDYAGGQPRRRAAASSSSATCRTRSRARWCWRSSPRARAAASRARS